VAYEAVAVVGEPERAAVQHRGGAFQGQFGARRVLETGFFFTDR
jgi:hypothetical protein